MNTIQEETREWKSDEEHGKLGILIVEDDEDTARMTATILQEWGFQTNVAFDGPTALRMARAVQPDVVLLDIGLPGMNGYELARLLYPCSPRDRRPLLIALTGLRREEDHHRSREAGIDLHLVKPVDPHALCSVLKRFRRLLKTAH